MVDIWILPDQAFVLSNEIADKSRSFVSISSKKTPKLAAVLNVRIRFFRFLQRSVPFFRERGKTRLQESEGADDRDGNERGNARVAKQKRRNAREVSRERSLNWRR